MHAWRWNWNYQDGACSTNWKMQRDCLPKLCLCLHILPSFCFFVLSFLAHHIMKSLSSPHPPTEKTTEPSTVTSTWRMGLSLTCCVPRVIQVGMVHAAWPYPRTGNRTVTSMCGTNTRKLVPWGMRLITCAWRQQVCRLWLACQSGGNASSRLVILGTKEQMIAWFGLTVTWVGGEGKVVRVQSLALSYLHHDGRGIHGNLRYLPLCCSSSMNSSYSPCRRWSLVEAICARADVTAVVQCLQRHTEQTQLGLGDRTAHAGLEDKGGPCHQVHFQDP